MTRRPKPRQPLTDVEREKIEKAALHLLREARRDEFTPACNRADFAQALGMLATVSILELIGGKEWIEWERRLVALVEAEPGARPLPKSEGELTAEQRRVALGMALFELQRGGNAPLEQGWNGVPTSIKHRYCDEAARMLRQAVNDERDAHWERQEVGPRP